jgi:hypothetical protein
LAFFAAASKSKSQVKFSSGMKSFLTGFGGSIGYVDFTSSSTLVSSTGGSLYFCSSLTFLFS